MRVCKTCRFAEWAKTPQGRDSRKYAGTCRWKPVNLPAVPIVIADEVAVAISHPGRYGIWQSDQRECDVWEPK